MKKLNLSPLQKKAGAAVVLLVVVLFPHLVVAVTVPVAAVVVWMSAQPVLVGAVIGAAFVARRRTAHRPGVAQQSPGTTVGGAA